MKKKILIISASPRRNGNSDILCDQFISGANESGHETEKIFIKDKIINYCTGCGYCSNKKNGCSQKDDMTDILNKMISTDVIVMATPVYFYAMNGQMKTFIDRMCARYTEINNKDIYFIATAADGRREAFEYVMGEFKGLLACLSGVKQKGAIFASGVWSAGDVKNTKFMKEAYEMGKKV